MTSIDDFIDLLRDELGLSVTPETISQVIDEVPEWDSVHLLRLLTILERETGKQISLPEMLEARSLQHIFDLTVAA